MLLIYCQAPRRSDFTPLPRSPFLPLRFSFFLARQPWIPRLLCIMRRNSACSRKQIASPDIAEIAEFIDSTPISGVRFPIYETLAMGIVIYRIDVKFAYSRDGTRNSSASLRDAIISKCRENFPRTSISRRDTFPRGSVDARITKHFENREGLLASWDAHLRCHDGGSIAVVNARATGLHLCMLAHTKARLQ